MIFLRKTHTVLLTSKYRQYSRIHRLQKLSKILLSSKLNMEEEGKARNASHAGSWYSSNADKLSTALNEAISVPKTHKAENGILKGIIGPHAGYDYCLSTAGHSYANIIDPAQYKRVILLGPSHHHHTTKCLLSKCTSYETPIGSIPIDLETVGELVKQKGFEYMDIDIDEAEHSLEMHCPLIRKVFQGIDIQLVPIMVGSLDSKQEIYFGKQLAPFADDSQTLFVISSDFCHWGVRFGYMPYNKTEGEIWESIKKLDYNGIKAIESGDPKLFANYLEQTENTICGRHPISIMMNAFYKDKTSFLTQFLHYEQSEKVKTKYQGSVSYAASITVKPI